MNTALTMQRSQSEDIEIDMKYDDEEEKGGSGGGLKHADDLLLSVDHSKHVGFKSAQSFVITPSTAGGDNDGMEAINEEENKDDDPFGHIHMQLQPDATEDNDDEDEHDESDQSHSMSDDDIETAINTRAPSLIGSGKTHKYPTYINKSLFHVSDDENLEVLVDEAVIKILSFNELWQDREGFVRCLYNDGEFASAVKRVYETLAAAYEKEKFGFFEEFVSKQYAREIQEHSLQMERFYDENDEEDLMGVDNHGDNEDSVTGDSDYEDIEDFKGLREAQWVFEVDGNGEYKIYEKTKQKKISGNKNVHKINVKQNPEGFSWAMFKSGKKIKTHYNTYHGGYWWICDEEKVSTEIHQWYNTLSNLQKRKKSKMKFKNQGKIKKWIGPSIPLKHLNIILGLVNHHYKLMIDPAKRKKIWKRKRKKEPIFAKFLPREMYEKHDDDEEEESDDDEDKKEEDDQIDGVLISTTMGRQQKNVDAAEKERQASLLAKQKIELADRSKAQTGKSTWTILGRGGSTKNEYIYDEKEQESVHIKIFDGDKEYLYDLFWWNSQSRSKVNSFCIKRGKDIDFKWQHYLYFRTNYYDLLKWEWYDNDQAEYKEYDQSEINVIKQLEATFQSNIQENFPIKHFHSNKNNKEPLFNFCQLPELQKILKEKGVRVGLGFVMRFSFTKNKRISNIEQLSLWRDNAEFARNVRRMYDGKNSLYNYFKDKNEYIEEWKRLYLLDTDEQQMFFWSHILTICACMKYINIEFENQMVSFAFERVNNLDSSILSQMDFNDVQREIRDMISWDGFLIPPTNLFQTNDVRIDENDLTDEDWLKKQGYATILIQWRSKHFQPRKKAKAFTTRIKSRQIYCGHDIDPRYQTYWQTTTGYTYCDDCAKLLQFAECIRKFVLEFENDEVVELLWPWYRNTFHAGSVDKYGKYINKYNLSHLYMEYDLLPDFANNDDDDGFSQQDDESFLCCWNRATNKYRSDDDNYGCCGNDGQQEDKDNKPPVPHIRHRRKFAAQLLLSGWEILRNLNIIRQQLLPIMNSFITSEIVDEELHYGDGKNRRAVEKHRLNIKFETKQYMDDRRYWWIDKIGEINMKLRKQIEENDWKTLFNFEHHDKLEIKQQHAIVFNEFVTVFLEDDREIAKEMEPEQYNKDYPDEYFREFLTQCTRTPKWWNLEHDKLLLELSLRFNYSSEEFLKELTGTKKRYYQYRLRTKPHTKSKIDNDAEEEDVIGHLDIDDDDAGARPSGRNMDVPVPFLRHMSGKKNPEIENEIDDLVSNQHIHPNGDDDKIDEEAGYQEFKAWCQVNENIMHRLKYITFLIIKKLSECAPSIIDLRIPQKNDQPTFDGDSYIFLNDYMKKTHIDFCQNFANEPDDMQEVAGTVNEASKYIVTHRQNWKQIQKDLQQIQHAAKPQQSFIQLSRKKSKDERRKKMFEPKSEIARAKYQKTMRDVLKGNRDVAISRPKMLPHAAPSFIHGPSSIKLKSTSFNAYQSQHSIKDMDNPRRGHYSRTATQMMNFTPRRTRDPFLRRDLVREFQEVVQSFDLLQHGELMAHFIIQLLKTKQLPSLWQALGVLLRIIPYKLALRILHETRGELRHGDPEDVAKVCREVMEGSNFLVPAALYLAEFMEKNANEDLAREQEWKYYSKSYETYAQHQINSIESDHLLAVLMDVPIYIKDLNLLQLALEQDRIQFLNNERINGVMSHVWYSSAFLDPTEDVEKGNQNWIQVFTLLFTRPFQFYLTPMGFNWTTGLSYIVYLIYIAFYILYEPVYPEDPVGIDELLLWICNVGYILNEVLEFLDQGRQYFAVNGLLNYFDIIISFFWMVLLGIRIHSFIVGEEINGVWISPYQQGGLEGDEYESLDQYNMNFWIVSRIYTTVWAAQLVLLCFRSLAVFLSSQYIGILFRMLELMMGQIVRFGLFIMTVLIGFLFGLYYIDNIPNRSDIGDSDNDGVYDHFLYLFTSLVGMAEVETHLKVGDELDEEDPMKIVAQVYSIFFIIFGTILSMNLLIALMTAEFDRVRSRANTEYAYARATLTYDLSHRNRFMAPPLNIFVLAITILVHWLNLPLALLFPDTLNVYYHLAFGHYDAMRNFNLVNVFCGCCMRKNKKKKKRNQFKRKNKSDAMSIVSDNAEWSQETNLNDAKSTCSDRCFGTLFCWFNCYSCCRLFKCCKTCNKRCRRWRQSRKKKSHTFMMNTWKLVLKYYFPSNLLKWCNVKKTQWNVYHAGCYNCIAKQRIEDSFESHAFHGIAMNQYFNIYETQRKTKLDALDKNLLKHLTVNTLFCQYCYRPFDKQHMEDELITPFFALMDIISCYFFFVFIWWALVLLIGFVAFLNVCLDSCNDDLSAGFSSNDDNDDDDDVDEFREYDREYWGSTSNHIEITQELRVNES